MRISYLLFFLISVLLTSCWNRHIEPGTQEKVWGYKAIYSQDPSYLQVRYDTARTIKNAGKIYTLGNKIFQNEIGYGIHVFDKSNLPQLVKTGFIHVIGNTEMSIKGNHLYANSFDDLLVIDISDLSQPVVVKKLDGAFNADGSSSYQVYLPVPEPGFPYTCVNNNEGIHTGWVKDSIFACYY